MPRSRTSSTRSQKPVNASLDEQPPVWHDTIVATG